MDYNDLKNLPSLNGVTLKGDVQMDIAGHGPCERTIGGDTM